MYLACYTQDEIAKEVGIGRKTVDDEIALLADLEDLPKSPKLHASFNDPEFKPPIYNVWTFAKKSNAVKHAGNSEQCILEALVLLNRQREKTSEQIAREAQVFMEVERKRARARMLATQNNRAARQHVAYQETQGKSTDVVGEKLGVSGETIRRSLKVVEKIDELTGEGETVNGLM